MAYVIIDTCTKDAACVDACPVDCIHPAKTEDGFADTPQLYINPEECIDCGACVPVCPVTAIFPEAEIPSESLASVDENADYYGLRGGE